MTNIVAFLMKHFANIQACPAGEDLGEMLEDAGFNDDDISNTLMFMQLLEENQQAMLGNTQLNQCQAMRIFNADELSALSPEIRGLLCFLEQAHAINPEQREFIIHALMFLPYDDITLENAKMLALLILWAHQAQSPLLIDDEFMTSLNHKNLMV